MNYREEIDGLRAIAVMSVIFYHAQFVILDRDWFEGGFIGVDVFFVISGYLITRTIFVQLEECGKFSLISFYERRARRILPMLLFIIAACIPFAWQTLTPLDLVDFAKSALSAIGFGSNFYFYFSTTEYGADSALLKPLLHTWSLGVEEQFYIFFPIIIILIWRFARHYLISLMVGIFLISIQFADVNNEINADLNFFLPFSRFWEMLIGSALAFIEVKYGRSTNILATQSLPILGLFLIAHGILFFDSSTPHPSFKTLIPVVGVGLIIAFCSKEDIVGKILSLKPIVGVGLLSYSLYLWHFPIFAFSRIDGSNPTNHNKVEWIAITLILSIVSYFLIEKPFRNKGLVNTKTFYSAIVIAVVVLSLISFNFILNKGYSDRLPPILSKSDLLAESYNRYVLDGKLCHNRRSNFCVENENENEISVYNIGDSHAAAISLELANSLKHDFRVVTATAGGCPFVFDASVVENGSVRDRCTPEFQKHRVNEVSNGNSIVLIMARYPLFLNGTVFNNEEGGQEAGNALSWRSTKSKSLEQAFTESIEFLLEKGSKVVLVYPLPEVGVHVPRQIMKSVKNVNITDLQSDFELFTTSYEVFKARSETTFNLFDSIESTDIFRVYPHTLFCDNYIPERCVTHNNDDVFYADDDHPSRAGAEIIVELIVEKIKEAEKNIRQN